MKERGKDEQVEQRKRCLACGAAWGLAFVRVGRFEGRKGIRCPFCGKSEAVEEVVEEGKSE